jgi:hypothetical protein
MVKKLVKNCHLKVSGDVGSTQRWKSVGVPPRFNVMRVLSRVRSKA